LVSAVIHPVGRGKREKERESCSKKKRVTKTETDREKSECQFERNCHILCGDYRREGERQTERDY
jgi:hypothetical protein